MPLYSTHNLHLKLYNPIDKLNKRAIILLKDKEVMKMKRSVYSLVLMDDVVEEIDRLAYSMNTSRSNLINQILAEKVSCVTPEKRMKSIFEQIENLMSDSCYQIQSQQSDAMMSIKSPVRYKYRPTVRYSVELYRNPSDSLGKLKVSFRTQSQQLINAVTDFFILWSQIEKKHIGRYFINGIPFTIENGRYTRKFTAVSISEKNVGAAIARYIQVMDKCLKLCFSDKDNVAQEIDGIYSSYLKSSSLII